MRLERCKRGTSTCPSLFQKSSMAPREILGTDFNSTRFRHTLSDWKVFNVCRSEKTERTWNWCLIFEEILHDFENLFFLFANWKTNGGLSFRNYFRTWKKRWIQDREDPNVSRSKKKREEIGLCRDLHFQKRFLIALSKRVFHCQPTIGEGKCSVVFSEIG